MEVIDAWWFNTQFTLGRIPYALKLQGMRGKFINPAVKVNIENDLYIVKTATTAEEMTQVLALRFEIFFREFSTQKVTFSLFPYDVDMHDFICDHLIIKDKKTDKVIACYRLLSECQKKFKNRFYSEGEFQLEEFLALKGKKLELGRACVHKDFRKGTVIALLWRGLLDYAKKIEAKYMFGCSSINRTDFKNLPQIMSWLKQNHAFIEDYNIGVQSKYDVDNHKDLYLNFELSEGEESSHKALGSLMHMYIMAGAKVSKIPAYDKEMDCLDLLTVMDLENMPSAFEKRFSK